MAFLGKKCGLSRLSTMLAVATLQNHFLCVLVLGFLFGLRNGGGNRRR
jgi:hypothetical protein